MKSNRIPQPSTLLDANTSLWCQGIGGLALFSGRGESRPIMEAGKPLAILVYLALAKQRRAGRDHVAELMWPSVPLPDARHSLRQSLYRLRSAANGRGLIAVIGDDLQLLQTVTFDFLDAEEAACEGDLDRARELLRGDFLGNFSIPESREFDSWAELERSRLRGIHSHVMHSLVNQSLASGDAERAFEIADELATLHPFEDDPVRLVMSALAGLNRYATALARFHAYAELLNRELDSKPDSGLESYAQEIQAYLDARPEPREAALPFVGRASQWSTLETAWQTIQRAGGRTILIEGSAGLGKTRILTELSGRVHSSGGLVLRGKCYEIERSVPYAVIAEALAGATDHPDLGALNPAWLAEASRLLPEFGERFANLPRIQETSGTQAAKRRLHQALSKCVEVIAEDTPVLLALDDIHWADGPSLEVLHTICHHLESKKVLIVATFRPAELTPTARQFARSLCAERAAELLILEPLTRDDVAQLLDSLGQFEASGSRDAVTLHLHTHSGGSPLFLDEVLQALRRSRILTVRDGRWVVPENSSIEDLPQTLAKLLADRIDRLAPWMRACVETIAVGAQDVPIEIIAKSLDLSEPRAALALAVLEEERLVKRIATTSYELMHDELRQLVYQSIPDERRRILHFSVGTALEALGEAKRPGGSARLAYHFDQAAAQEQAHRYAMLAADEAAALSATEAQAHIKIAEAHAPRALAPGVSGREMWLPEPWRAIPGIRWAALVAAVLVVALASSLAIAFLGRGIVADSSSDYRQGTLYLREPVTDGATHRVRWASAPEETSAIEKLRHHPPDLPAQLLIVPVTDAGETHNKIFLIRDADSVQLTQGSSDDGTFGWAPDGRYILASQGFRSSEGDYRVNLVLLDTLGHLVRKLTDSRHQDQNAAWSPTGAQFAFVRNADAHWSTWVSDADGSNSVNLTTRWELPDGVPSPSFSPDGRRLAIAYNEVRDGSGAVYVLDLDQGTAYSLPLAHQLLGAALWSPDGRWLAFIVRDEFENALIIAPADGSRPSVRIGPVSDLRLGVWTDGSPRHIEVVTIEPAIIDLRTGHGVVAQTRIALANGEAVPAPIRWSVMDTAIARVDDQGFVLGRRAGVTWLVASAGGFRADTAQVNVVYATVDTLFLEDWSRGIEPTRWSGFGTPASIVVFNPQDSRNVFLNNGDFNHGSGVISRERFEVSTEGITLEAHGWLRFTGGHWQIWNLGLAVDGPVAAGGEFGGGSILITLAGPEPTKTEGGWSCATDTKSVRHGTIERIASGPGWHGFAVQLRPDGRFECFADGLLLGTGLAPPETLREPLAIALRGHSVGTEIYHGRVLLTRGLRY